MVLKRVPGVRNYMADDTGLAEVARSGSMQSAMMDTAREVAGTAASVGNSEYGAKPATVTVGWQNEKRAGAVAYESKWHWDDWRNAILKRTAAAMSKRGGRR